VKPKTRGTEASPRSKGRKLRRSTGRVKALFLHFTILKAWRKSCAKALRNRQGECLGNQDGGDSFPRFRNRINID